jgi:tRNA threonylcarbamoyladenosine biosynthesis protein TsaB
MALILSLETSGRICSVALHENSKLLSNAEIHQEQSHASQLAVLIEKVIKDASVSVKEVNAVAVSSGPGSYTGLRIGTSTAKGICYALNIPLIAVDTLYLLAFQAHQKLQEFKALLCPMIDAKRMEVFCQIIDSQLNAISSVESKVIEETSFIELLESNKMFFFGDGAVKCKTIIQHRNAEFLEGILAQASSLGLIAHKKLEAKQFEDVGAFKPFYLKEFVAKKAQSVF